MDNKRKTITNNDIDQVIAKTGSSNPGKSKTEERSPRKKQANADLKDQTEQPSPYVNKPHMLFR